MNEKIKNLLVERGVSEESFLIMAKMENLTDEEMSDIGYIEDRVDVWIELEMVQGD